VRYLVITPILIINWQRGGVGLSPNYGGVRIVAPSCHCNKIVYRAANEEYILLQNEMPLA